jgi:hypothetical protein
MAKGKNTTALFEVISRNKANAGRGPLAALGALFRPRQALEPAEPTLLPASAAEAPPLTAPAATGPADQPNLLVDTDRREVSLKLSYASIIIAAFAFVTVIGAAYLVGRKATSAPGPVLAVTSSEDLQRQPAQSSVLNLRSEPSQQVEAPGPMQRQTAPEPQRTSAPAAPVTAHGKNRVVGLNYIIVQSYPDEKLAGEAVKALADHGVEATIERNLKWGNANWCFVVGVEGFSKITNSPQFDAHARKIKEISAKYTGGSKKPSFKAFDPSPYKWRPEDAR